jgi:HEAT repeat protein
MLTAAAQPLLNGEFNGCGPAERDAPSVAVTPRIFLSPRRGKTHLLAERVLAYTETTMNRRPLSCLALAAALFAASAGRVAADAVDDPAAAEGAREALVAGRPLAAWVKELNDADPAMRVRAARALGTAGPDASAAVPALLRRRDDPDPGVRVEAVAAVCRVGGLPAREMVRGMILDNDKKCPDPAFDKAFLQKVGPAARPPLFELLLDPEAHAAALAALGPDASLAVPGLLDQLALGDGPTRAAAVRALGLINPAEPDVAPVLRKALEDPDGLVRVRAARALWATRKETRASVPVLADALHDEAVQARREAAETLGQFGAAAAPAARDLAAALEGADYELGYHAGAALQAIGPEDALPAVIAALGDPAAPCRSHVFDWLRSYGPAAKDAVPALRAALKGPDAFDRLLAAESLLAIDPDKAEETVPALVLGAASDEPRVVAFAAQLAQRVGPAAAQVGPSLAVAMRHPDIHIRLSAADALARIDRKNAPAVLPVLADGVRALSADDRRQAVSTLVFLGPDSRPAAPVLVAALQEYLNKPAAQAEDFRPLVLALVKIGAGEHAVPPLVQHLADPDPDRREEVLYALMLIGKDAKAAVPAVRAAAKDKDENVREAAKELFHSITGEALPDDAGE